MCTASVRLWFWSMQTVRIGEIKLGREIKLVGLGSCVAAILVCQRTGACAAAHVFLPTAERRASAEKSVGAYADTAIAEMVRQMAAAGVRQRDLVAVMCGGARMFAHTQTDPIGPRNVEAVKAQLHSLGLRVVADQTGGTRGVSVFVEGTDCVRVSVAPVGSERTPVATVRVAAAAA